MQLKSNVLSRGNRYALILVDMCVGFTNPALSPLASDADNVVAANQQLLAFFRERSWPVFFTTVAYSDESQATVFREKLPALNVLQVGSGLEEIDARLTPRQNEPVLVKHWASGFFATDLHDRLQAAGVDGTVVTGLTTSGCVRATALDSLQYNYRTLVPREAVSDRDAAAHEANLRDLGIKYVDVLSLEETLRFLA
ncbi:MULTISPECIES: isochorismatase family protein [unclassified Marinobacter]|jgi:nicotinamidase-related amidase|uniref:isochorismatase family protein n=1 Tax=unclassified Marinobacter TaxID=83889 RepID=UPI00200D2A59|nr:MULTISPECIES: isochorismatase family protein [unclassified Marinobacter]MCL1479639.1 isochorismatase family protein [Marinobacter sp.]MCL1485225.1 isochorismatase family protein [Marinobacter sp.]MCL1488868.1 isochorismatase family protein [Marinobacter sp.]UQG55025.1 isochorismatase family protein [Marinobacter sp. M4C]UQG63826.1 isochorismatase family protein [Marinobacter sp. M2C]